MQVSLSQKVPNTHGQAASQVASSTSCNYEGTKVKVCPFSSIPDLGMVPRTTSWPNTPSYHYAAALGCPALLGIPAHTCTICHGRSRMLRAVLCRKPPSPEAGLLRMAPGCSTPSASRRRFFLRARRCRACNCHFFLWNPSQTSHSSWDRWWGGSSGGGDTVKQECLSMALKLHSFQALWTSRQLSQDQDPTRGPRTAQWNPWETAHPSVGLTGACPLYLPASPDTLRLLTWVVPRAGGCPKISCQGGTVSPRSWESSWLSQRTRFLFVATGRAVWGGFTRPKSSMSGAPRLCVLSGAWATPTCNHPSGLKTRALYPQISVLETHLNGSKYLHTKLLITD